MKLASLRLQNFQSHQDTSAEFSPGINAFVGASDKGKTANIRALTWLATNTPTGDAIISDWARDESGNILDDCAVTAVTEQGEIVRRIKAKGGKRNGYDVNGERFDAIRTSVPPAVTNLLNLEAVNWQRQLDPPFLLSESGGARARFFNQLIRLEEIGECLSLAESLRRKVEGSIQPLEVAIASREKEVEALGWVDGAAERLVGLRQLVEEAKHTQSRSDELGSLLYLLKGEQERVAALKAAEQFAPRIEALRGVVGELIQVSRKSNTLAGILDELKPAQTLLDRTKGLGSLGKVLQEVRGAVQERAEVGERRSSLQSILQELTVARETLSRPSPQAIQERVSTLRMIVGKSQTTYRQSLALGALLVELREGQQAIRTATSEITSIQEQLPEICPLCSGTGRLKGHDHGQNPVA